jgi:hypothetical protein
MKARRRELGFACLLLAAVFGGCKKDGGGSSMDPRCPSFFPDDLISDFANDNSIAAEDGRQGGWYTYGDDNGSFATTTGYEIDLAEGNPSCSGPGALHVQGTGFSMWGAATGVDFKPRPSDGDGGYGKKMTYDAGGYRGIAFWAKSSAPLNGVQISFPDLYTDEAAPSHDMPDPLDPDPTNPTSFLCRASDPDPCNCIYRAGSLSNCSPYLVQFGKTGDGGAAVLFTKYMNAQINQTWGRFEVLFADTRQDPGNVGYHHPSADRLTASALTGMAIQINANYDATGAPSANDFNLWIDDVSFIK